MPLIDCVLAAFVIVLAAASALLAAFLPIALMVHIAWGRGAASTFTQNVQDC